MFCHETFNIWVGGCCQLDLFPLNKIFFTRILDVKDNYWGQVCFWTRNMPESCENETWAEGADQKDINNFCFNGCHPIRTFFFCLVSMLRCKRRYCCLRISTYFLRCCTMYVFSLSGQWILKMVKEKGKLKQRKRWRKEARKLLHPQHLLQKKVVKLHLVVRHSFLFRTG